MPLDELVLGLMKGDANGRILADVTAKETSRCNLPRACQRSCVDVLSDPLVHEIVTTFFPLSSDKKLQHMAMFRSCVVELASSVHYRLNTYLGECPFTLIRVVHPQFTEDERKAAATEFFNTPKCCMDEFLSQPLFERCHAPE
eukprot:6562756-Pyramimonas_sp.AAC.1